MPSSIAPGHFVLHSNAIPTLPAGSYVVRAQQSFSAEGATTTTLDSHVEVTGPRFTLPPDQILSTFPPNKSEGAFSARLPQIVLKRRSLPWERMAAPGLAREIPWLALVLLADGEAEFHAARPVAECVTAGVTLTGRGDTAVADSITVTQTVVEKVFPTKDDLPLLTHVREVDLSDTELAMGDDDGWLAVVLCNRLPQSGVRYRACLVSLEGQYDVLAASADVEPDPPAAFESPFVYPNAVLATGPGIPTPLPVETSVSIVDAWSREAQQPKFAATQREVRRVDRTFTAAHVGAMHTVGTLDLSALLEPRFTFPVLANWQFTCVGDADFRTLIQRLDVGMLDTVERPPVVRLGQKPPPPRSRPEPQVTDTGHVALSHTTRTGEDETVWYRGPLLPHPGRRDTPNAAGELPLLHASDQARRIGPDGRENLALAAAFEIGRLLALAEPNVVASFLNWRKQGLETARCMEFANVDVALKRVDVAAITRGFAARIGNVLLTELGAAGAARLGAPRPAVDGGCPIDGIDGVDLTQLIATGLGIQVDIARELLGAGLVGGVDVSAPVGSQAIDASTLADRTAQEFGHLRDAARQVVDSYARDALAGGVAGAGDALDAALRGRTGP